MELPVLRRLLSQESTICDGTVRYHVMAPDPIVIMHRGSVVRDHVLVRQHFATRHRGSVALVDHSPVVHDVAALVGQVTHAPLQAGQVVGGRG